MIKELLANWPLLKQIKTGTDGTGPEAMSEQTRSLKPKFADAQVARRGHRKESIEAGVSPTSGVSRPAGREGW